MFKPLLKSAARAFGYQIQHLPVVYGEDVYRRFYSADHVARKAFYNFGSGDWRHPFWTNVDYASDYYGYDSGLIDIPFDITEHKPLPVETASAALAYCSHTVEHLRDQDCEHLFAEAARILAPGGVFRVTTPNARLIWEAYKRGDVYIASQYYFGTPNYSDDALGGFVVGEIASQLVANRLADQTALLDALPMAEAFDAITGAIDFNVQRKNVGQHVNWWDFDKLRTFLLRAGFSDVVPSGAGQSIATVMRDRNYFDLQIPGISLFVDAVR